MPALTNEQPIVAAVRTNDHMQLIEALMNEPPDYRRLVGAQSVLTIAVLEPFLENANNELDEQAWLSLSDVLSGYGSTTGEELLPVVVEIMDKIMEALNKRDEIEEDDTIYITQDDDEFDHGGIVIGKEANKIVFYLCRCGCLDLPELPVTAERLALMLEQVVSSYEDKLLHLSQLPNVHSWVALTIEEMQSKKHNFEQAIATLRRI